MQKREKGSGSFFLKKKVTPKPLAVEQCAEGLCWEDKSVDPVDCLFFSGGQDGAQGCESSGTFEGSEAAGDFHFKLHHPDVSFGLIVGERHGEIGGEAEHVLFEVAQPEEQIMANSPWRLAACARLSLQWGLLLVKRKALFEDLLVPTRHVGPDIVRQSNLALLDQLCDQPVG
jgi:hypothetical protein